VNGLAELTEFAKRYAKAWCSQNPESVAAFFAENGSISINNGPPAVAEEAQAFMTNISGNGRDDGQGRARRRGNEVPLDIDRNEHRTRRHWSTARSTNVSSSTERNLDGTRESGLHLRHEIKDSVSHSGTLFWNGDGLFRRERADGDMEAERQKIEARRDGKK